MKIVLYDIEIYYKSEGIQTYTLSADNIDYGGEGYFFIILITGLISMPLMHPYLQSGFDTNFHLMKMEEIKNGLLSGQFPVRMQPNWFKGHGDFLDIEKSGANGRIKVILPPHFWESAIFFWKKKGMSYLSNCLLMVPR